MSKIVITPENFLKKFIQTHGYKYDYSKSIYLDSKTKIEIGCPKHGVFFQKAYAHFRGNGCLKCRFDSQLVSKEKIEQILALYPQKPVQQISKILNISRQTITQKILELGLEPPSQRRKMKTAGRIPKKYWSSVKSNAKKRNLDIQIDVEYAWNILVNQKFKCALTGNPIDFIYQANTASLDRIDSTKAYIEGNIQWVHKDINKLKINHNEKTFYKMCRDVAKYRKDLNSSKIEWVEDFANDT